MDKDDLRREISDRTQQWGKLFYGGNATGSCLAPLPNKSPSYGDIWPDCHTVPRGPEVPRRRDRQRRTIPQLTGCGACGN